MNWLNELVEHYRESSDYVDLFGLILYTDAHANIKKAVMDEDYWSSFNEISGKNWVVFSVRPKIGSYDMPDYRPGQMGFMHSVWKEPNDNKSLLAMFNLRDTRDLPILLVFTHDHNENILKSSMNLNDSSVDAAYSSIKKALIVATEAVDRIEDEYRKNTDGVYRAVDIAVSSHKEWEIVKKGMKYIPWIKSLVTED